MQLLTSDAKSENKVYEEIHADFSSGDHGQIWDAYADRLRVAKCESALDPPSGLYHFQRAIRDRASS